MNCGNELSEGAKFCSACGKQIVEAEKKPVEEKKRETEYVGTVKKCPACGEPVQAFQVRCPACGYEYRDSQVSNAVKEFANKLEMIEAQRISKKSWGLFGLAKQMSIVSKVDAQKVSLIKSFAIPNSKEDMLEFVILASSNIDLGMYNQFNRRSESEKRVSEAWIAKMQQARSKAQIALPNDETLDMINRIYDDTLDAIKKAKRKEIIKIVAILLSPIVFIGAILAIALPQETKAESEEEQRLEAIVEDINDSLEQEEYSKALKIAASLDYTKSSSESERKWDIERENWIDKVIMMAESKGIELEYPMYDDVDNANDSSSES